MFFQVWENLTVEKSTSFQFNSSLVNEEKINSTPFHLSQAVEEGLARAVLTAMGDTKVEEVIFYQLHKKSVENIQIQVEKFLAEPLSLAVIDQVTKEGWEEGWQVEEEEEEMEEENGKVEENNIGGKKEELGRIPLTVPRSLLCLQIWKNLIDLRTFWMYCIVPPKS